MDDLIAEADRARSADPEEIKAKTAELTKEVSNMVNARSVHHVTKTKKRNIHSQSMDDLIPHPYAFSTRRVDPDVSDSTTTMPHPQTQPPRNSTPAAAAVTVLSAPLSLGSLVDFQDRIILLAAQIAGEGKQDIGSLIIDKICTDAIAQRVVEAYHRQKISAEQTIEGLKNLYMITRNQ